VGIFAGRQPKPFGAFLTQPDFGRGGCQTRVAVSLIVLSQLWNDSRFHILDEPFAINAGQDIV
jgi:hypothetical protein